MRGTVYAYIMFNLVITFNDDSSITNVHNNAMAGGGIITQEKSDNPVFAWLNFKIFKIA